MARKKNKADQQRRRQAKAQARQKRRSENARSEQRAERAGAQSGGQGGGQDGHQGSSDLAHPPAGGRADADPVSSPSDTWEATDSLRLAGAVEAQLDAEADESGIEEALSSMLELIADGLQAAVQRTVDERAPAPARVYTHWLVETDSDTAAEDAAAEGLGLALAARILLDWLRLARAELATPALTDELLRWVEANLGPDLAAPAKKATGLAENEQLDPDERIELVDSLGTDLLPALIWLTAGLVATRASHEAGWLRRYDEEILG